MVEALISRTSCGVCAIGCSFGVVLMELATGQPAIVPSTAPDAEANEVETLVCHVSPPRLPLLSCPLSELSHGMQGRIWHGNGISCGTTLMLYDNNYALGGYAMGQRVRKERILLKGGRGDYSYADVQ